MKDKSIQEEIRVGVAYHMAQAQGSLGEDESIYDLSPCDFASAMQNADCILKYLDSKGVRICHSPRVYNLVSHERLIEE